VDDRATGGRARPLLVRALSWFNAAYPLAAVAIIVASVHLDSDFFKRSGGALVAIGRTVAVGWVLLVPATCLAGLLLNRRVRWRPAWWMNGAVLALWALFMGAQLFVLLSGAFPSVVR
jgi:hypothetical protein